MYSDQSANLNRPNPADLTSLKNRSMDEILLKQNGPCMEEEKKQEQSPRNDFHDEYINEGAGADRLDAAASGVANEDGRLTGSLDDLILRKKDLH